jgi:rare lipoprotein A
MQLKCRTSVSRLLWALFLGIFLVSFTQQKAEVGVEFSGRVSYYHKKFQGRKTASGDRFDNQAYTCAHRSLPFGTLIEVINPSNGKWVVVRVNDRGPFSKQRIIDLSYAAAKQLGMLQKGEIKANARVVGLNRQLILFKPGMMAENIKNIFSQDSLKKIELPPLKETDIRTKEY